jgi:cell wall-associated NlpC family hydrolase
VAAAESVIGDPYVYGAAGPSSFDCSGLTMWAWAHGGVSLPHSSQSQYASTTHVAISAVQPGDLLFYYSDIHHVAMYVGGGMMVEAPHTGANVREVPMRLDSLVGAGRPG